MSHTSTRYSAELWPQGAASHRRLRQALRTTMLLPLPDRFGLCQLAGGLNQVTNLRPDADALGKLGADNPFGVHEENPRVGYTIRAMPRGIRLIQDAKCQRVPSVSVTE